MSLSWPLSLFKEFQHYGVGLRMLKLVINKADKLRDACDDFGRQQTCNAFVNSPGVTYAAWEFVQVAVAFQAFISSETFLLEHPSIVPTTVVKDGLETEPYHLS